MTIRILTIGKNHESWIKEGVDNFLKRLRPPFLAEFIILPSSKNSKTNATEEESATILRRVSEQDYVILLDEHGKNLSSPELSNLVESTSSRQIVIIIGGAFGVSQSVKDRANLVWSFSKLVFPHQLVRLILAEQLYRAQDIARGGKYHHS